jgi:hypothetical protein
MAKLAGDSHVLVTSSRTPFLDAARRLLELGYPPDTVLVMQHPNSQCDRRIDAPLIVFPMKLYWTVPFHDSVNR